MRKGNYQGIVVIILGLLYGILAWIVHSLINISGFVDSKEKAVELLAFTIVAVFLAPLWSWTDKLYERKFKKTE